MTLFEIVDILKKIALNQPNIRSVSDGSVYDALNNNPSVHYDVFHISQTTHQEDFETDYYGLQLFYISRLEDSLEDNRLQIQSIGKEILGNVIRTFSENFSIDYPTITYIPFTQRFNDLTAGVYCNVRLEVPKDLVCADDYTAETVPGSGLKLQDIGITINENGLRVITADAEYDGIGEIRIQTEVPQSAAVLQDKEVEYTENGSYTIHPDPDYDGLSSVSVDVDVPDRYDEGYEDGKQDGENEQKAKLTVTSFTENNTYTRADGWSAVTVDVPQTGQTINNQTKSYPINNIQTQLIYYDKPGDEKWMYTFENSPLTLTYDSGYTGLEKLNLDLQIDAYQAIELGKNQQKAKMVSTAITENGTYTREDGYSAFNVEVPQTGPSNEDLIANLQGDYYLIPYGTTHLRDYAFYVTCFSSITIPTTVSAIGKDAFAFNECLTSITLPDSVQYLGRYAFQGADALETVIIGSGISEIQTRTFSGCRALTGITIPSGVTSIGINVFDGCSALTEMTFEGLTPPTLEDTGNSLGSTAYTFPIYVPCQSLDAYKTAFGKYYAPRIQCKEEPQPTGDTAITAITLVVDSAITDSGTATTTYSPIDVPTDIYYTSSNPSIARVDSGTGVITVIADGTVTICVNDRISGLQDCKAVTVVKSVETSITINVVDVITGTATATTTVTPASATTNLRYSSSDTTKATINATTGVISVVSSGLVTFCVTDTISSKQSCKTSLVLTGDSAVSVLDFKYATTAANQTNILFYGTAQDNSANFDRFYNALIAIVIDENLVTKNSANIVTPTVERNYKRYKHTFANAGIHNVKYYVRRAISGDGLAGLELTNLLFADNLGEMHLVSAKVGSGYEILGNGTFQGGSELTSVTIPNSVSAIGPYTFEYTAIRTLNIPNSVVTLTVIAPGFPTDGEGICNHCTSLTSVTIGSGLTKIPAYTFQDCTALRDIIINRTTPPTLESLAFTGCSSLTNIYVPASSVNTYKSASGWSQYASKIKAKP